MWLKQLPSDGRLIFSRFTQLGLLRLLTTEGVMGDEALNVRQALGVYDAWVNDPRVEFHAEPRAIGAAFRDSAKPLAGLRAPKAIGDCYLLAFAKQTGATLVTFDK